MHKCTVTWRCEQWYTLEHPLYSTAHGPLARYVKLRVAHVPGMPGTFSPPPRVSDYGMHHGTCVAHVPWCMKGSLTSVFLWSRWRGKRSRHSRRMRKPQFYVSGKRPIILHYTIHIMHGNHKSRKSTRLWNHKWNSMPELLSVFGDYLGKSVTVQSGFSTALPFNCFIHLSFT